MHYNICKCTITFSIELTSKNPVNPECLKPCANIWPETLFYFANNLLSIYTTLITSLGGSGLQVGMLL